ncbi:MAG: CADD family putative folate metabolism protein [Elusimicrobia bacterium]|nr:CADD family putative folate metabolism protein [Elusimicrobiota bacterium]MDE2426737.1 CADD family putative folate metabolism protein [Elusimicrobiota bacterium]
MSESWWREVEAILEQNSLLKHPFYQAWTQGRLTRDDLAHYARQYYHQESRFPRYVSAVHSNCPELKVRQMLLENLSHEESGPDNHPELWLRFAEAVGASRESVLSARIHPKTAECVAVFEEKTREANWQAGLAALYAYEAQQPAVARTKIEGLRKSYGLDSKDALGFFEAHQTLDVWHSKVERDVLLDQVREDPELKHAVKAAVSDACGALNALLDGVCEARGLCATA